MDSLWEVNRRITVGLVAVLALAAASAAIVVANAAGQSPAERSLALWTQFPATALPRPVVPLFGPVLAPSDGFPTDAAKLAFNEGRFILDAKLPATPTVLDGYRLRSAASAFGLLKADPGKGPTAPPLEVRGVDLRTATFDTDRGAATLPAWIFLFRGVDHPAAVLALTQSEVFEPPRPVDFHDTATMSSGGRDLTVTFVGAPAGTQPCDASYTATATADAHAVAFTILTRAVPVPPNEACSLVGYSRTATIHLAAPLAGRVLIDARDGEPVAVTEHH